MLRVGSKVLVQLPPDTSEPTLRNSPLWEFDGMEATISKVCARKYYQYLSWMERSPSLECHLDS